MGRTSIEWTDRSWPVVNGCRRISPGCEHCYAERLTATRLAHTPKYQGLAVMGEHGPRWTGETRLWEPHLADPLKVKKPSKFFVADMGDLFYEGVAEVDIAEVFAVMALAHWHTFQALTKRANRMRVLVASPTFRELVARKMAKRLSGIEPTIVPEQIQPRWPLSNVWMGVSVESQRYAAERIPDLIATPAAVRFLSIEPLLQFTTIARFLKIGGIHWVIVGGESGPGARPMDPEWVRAIRDECAAAGVAYFFKQWGGVRKKLTGRVLDGRTWEEFPR